MVFYLSLASGQDLIVYPAKGQSAQQVETDKFECYSWAKSQTGFDPSQPQQTAQAPAPQSQGPQGAAVKGAAVGAAGGGTLGVMKRRAQKRQEAQVQEQQAQARGSQYEAKRSEYNRAYAACLEGKGYVVK
jgi:hypothetical protein